MEVLQESDPVARFARIVGVLFLAASFVVLITLLVVFWQFVSEPDTVLSIGLFADFLNSDAPVVTVMIEGREAVVNFDPTLRLILVIFVGAFSILALASVIHACTGGGLMLVKFARQRLAVDGA